MKVKKAKKDLQKKRDRKKPRRVPIGSRQKKTGDSKSKKQRPTKSQVKKYMLYLTICRKP